ncbi:MAG TPA: hypothetical protein VIE36_11065 [Methylomirabilota bacterium]|jgi:hypothetical protein
MLTSRDQVTTAPGSDLGVEGGGIRIATVCKPLPLRDGDIQAMDTVRWMRVSEALARAGFRVDMMVGVGAQLARRHPNLGYVPITDADWSAYDVVKTLYQRGFQELSQAGGASHPFIISRLASVVGGRDGAPGVHFFGAEREALYETQRRIDRASRYVSFSSDPNRTLWHREFRTDPSRLLLVPTGVERVIPGPRRNPYRALGITGPIAVYIGHLYLTMQRHINLLWQERLNSLGRLLRRRGITLAFIGPGATDRLDPAAVVNIGPIAHDDIWDYQYFADVGLVLAQGPIQQNESSKIFYYLRSGLPVVSEEPVPNNDVLVASGCGLVAPFDDDPTFADMVETAARRPWDREAAIAYVLAHHTWDHRIATYARAIAGAFRGIV